MARKRKRRANPRRRASRRNPGKRRRGRRRLSRKQIAAGFGGGKRRRRSRNPRRRRRNMSTAVGRSAAIRALSPAQVAAGFGGAVSGIKKKKKHYRRPRFGARHHGRWPKGRRVSRPRSKSGRHRPYKGRTVMVPMHRGRRMAGWRRRALVEGGYVDRQGHVNPRRRRNCRRGRRNPGRARRHRNPGHRHHRRHRNPGGVAGFFESAKNVVFSGKFWIASAEVVAGISAATVIPALAETLSKGRLQNSGALGVAMSAVSAGVAFGAAYGVEQFFTPRGGKEKHWALQGFARYVGLGAGAATILRGLFAFAPTLADWLKLSPVRTPVVYLPGMAPPPPAPPAPMPMVPASGAAGLYGGLYGMGEVDAASANEALIAGESFARSVSQFEGMGDWLELKGMGDWLELKGMGDYRLPMQNIRGPGQLAGGYPGQYGAGTYDPYHNRRYGIAGMGDFLETDGTSAAPVSWEPAMETF